MLHYLLFDATDNGDGSGTWEAVASVRAEHVPAVMAEVQAVLEWAERHAPGPRAPLDDGGAWDVNEQTLDEGEWTTVSLTLTGPWAWGESLATHFTLKA